MSNHSVRIKNRCAWWQIWQKKNNRVLIGLEYPHSFWRESKIFPHGTNPVPFICGINFFRDRSFVYSSYSFRLCQLIAIRFFHVCATWLDNFFLPFFEKLKVQLVKKYDNAQKDWCIVVTRISSVLILYISPGERIEKMPQLLKNAANSMLSFHRRNFATSLISRPDEGV